MPSKLSIEAIEVIDTIARKGSFAAAASTLHKVPSALTYTVRKLEEDLNVTIFDRSGHKAILTDAGQALLTEGRILINAAHELEAHVQRIATGVETDITIVVSDLYEDQAIFNVLHQFYAQGFGTKVKIIREVFGGAWDAILSNRADIAVGAPGDAPSGSQCETQLIGSIPFVFSVAPNHPLASIERPLTKEDIMAYRSVAAADSSRNLPPRTAGILTGQEVLTMPDIPSKINAQIAGLGVGYIPEYLAKRHEAKGELVIKNIAGTREGVTICLAWKNNQNAIMGKSQEWLLNAFKDLPLEALLR
jgi:DNA-binding transcriptional LysR family regulator